MIDTLIGEQSLADFVSERTKADACRELALSRQGLDDMLNNRRMVWVKRIDGVWHYCEFKQWRRGRS